MKKMNKKGFTLIELLAIIVILAIIAVITVPLILGIIDEAKEKSAISSVVGYGKAVELAYSHYQLGTDATLKKDVSGDNGDVVTPDELSSGSYIKLKLSDTETIALKVDFSGDKVVCNTANKDNTVSGGKVTLTGCLINGSGSNYVYDNGRGCKSDGTSCAS